MKSPDIRFEMVLGVALRGAGAVSSFVLIWLIAHEYGAPVVGRYQVALTTVSLLSLIASAGLDVALVRHIGAVRSESPDKDTVKTLAQCRKYTLQMAVLVTVLLLCAAPLLSLYIDGNYRLLKYFLVFAPSITLLAMLKLSNSFLRSFGFVKWSQTLEGVFYTTFAALVLATFWATGIAVSPLIVASSYVLAMFLAFLISHSKVRYISRPAGNSATSFLSRGSGAKIGAVMAITNFGNLLILYLVGAWLGIGDAGIFRTAMQVAMVLQLINAAFAMMIGPHMARAAAINSRGEILRLIANASLIGLLLSAPIGIACVVYPEFVLGLFGDGFRTGSDALQILFFALLLDVLLGQTGTALVMQMKEGRVFLSEFVAVLAALAMAFILIPKLGMVGAAFGVLAMSMVRNLSNLAFLFHGQRLRINLS